MSQLNLRPRPVTGANAAFGVVYCANKIAWRANVPIGFNPFRKPLRDIQPPDLAVLRQVGEGWYVEYKAEFQPLKTVAKALCAFANHYGGWLFYGVKEKAKELVADSFPGIDVATIVDVERALRDAAAQHVAPVPYFEHRVLKGPCPEIGLASDRAVVIVAIEPGANAPYVHSSGRIYRRVGDSSDPTEETDRSVLDILWERGKRSRDRLAEFIHDDPVRSKEESELAYIQLILMSDPLGDRGYTSKLTVREFAEIIKRDKDPGGLVHVPMQNAFPTSNGFVARQIGTNDPFHSLLTFRYYLTCGARANIPVRSANLAALHGGQMRMFLKGYENSLRFESELRKQRIDRGTLLDINHLVHLLVALTAKYRVLAEHDGHSGPFYAKLKINNIWRSVAFLDLPAFMDHLGERGVPMIQDTDVLAPPGVDPNDLIELRARPDGQSIGDLYGSDMSALIVPVLYALGVDPAVLDDSTALTAAALRGIKVYSGDASATPGRQVAADFMKT